MTLPVEIDPDRVQADYRDGILALQVPAAEPAETQIDQGELSMSGQVDRKTEADMAGSHELTVAEKRALSAKDERTFSRKVLRALY